MIKPYFETELGKLYCGNCIDIMNQLKDIDTIITSPPYNKNGFRGRLDCSKGKGRWQNADIKYDTLNDWMDEDKYKNLQKKFLNKCNDIIKLSGSIFYNHKIRRANSEASHPYQWIIKSKNTFYQQIVWNRKSSCDHNINYCVPTTELIFWLTKDIPKVYKQQAIFNTEIWNISPLPDNEHPAPFPIKLSDNCILLTTKENDLILDPFIGTGTTAISAEKLNREWIGIEISEKYCEIAAKRIEAEAKQGKFDL